MPMGISGNEDAEFAYMDWVESLENHPSGYKTPELPNTEMLYCARNPEDASETEGFEVVFRGAITEEQIAEIAAMMHDERFKYKTPAGRFVTVTVHVFQPELVGLPVSSKPGYIHDIGEGGDWNYWPTEADPTVDMTVSEFIQKYREAIND